MAASEFPQVSKVSQVASPATDNLFLEEVLDTFTESYQSFLFDLHIYLKRSIEIALPRQNKAIQTSSFFP